MTHARADAAPGAGSPAHAYLQSSVPGLIASGLVDLVSGDFREVETRGSHPSDFLSYLAMTTRAFFEGDAVRTIQAVLDEAVSEPPPSRAIEEITIRSHGCLHALVRVPSEPDTVLVAVTTRDTKIGLVLNALHKAVALV